MAQLTEETLAHIVDQSRLYVTEEETAGVLNELNDNLAYIEKIHELDTKGVAPTINGNANVNIVREDIPVKWDERDAALNHAPEHDGAHFKVPAIMD